MPRSHNYTILVFEFRKHSQFGNKSCKGRLHGSLEGNKSCKGRLHGSLEGNKSCKGRLHGSLETTNSDLLELLDDND